MTTDVKPPALAAQAAARPRGSKAPDRIGACIFWCVGCYLSYRGICTFGGLSESWQLAAGVTVVQAMLTLTQWSIWRVGLDTFRAAALVADVVLNVIGIIMPIYGLTVIELLALSSAADVVVNVRLLDYVIVASASLAAFTVAAAPEYLWERRNV